MLRTTPNSFHLAQRASHQSKLHHGRVTGSLNNVVHEIYNSSYLSEVDKSDIYNEWVASGKPHNIVCSGCHNPEGLMLFCETCCRSYHASCLPQGLKLVSMATQFHCSACKEKQWDHSPPRFSSISSPAVSCASSPSPQAPTRVSSPSSSATPCASNVGGSARSAFVTPTAQHLSTVLSGNHGVPTPFDAFRPETLSRAREFLLEHGRFSNSQDFPIELLLKLGSMMTEVESRHSLEQQIDELRAENATLRKDNASIRAYFDSSLPMGKPMFTSITNIESTIHRPPPDTSGKSWDRIVMDLI